MAGRRMAQPVYHQLRKLTLPFRHLGFVPGSNIQAEACATANLLLRLFNLDSAARTDSRRVKNHLAVLCHRVMGDLRWFN